MKLSSLIGKLQIPFPVSAHVYPSPDGHVFFSGTNGSVDAVEAVAGLGSEMDYAAAYKFCQHLLPTQSTPTHNSGTPNFGDVGNIKDDRDNMAAYSMAGSECLRALAYRTSCPAVSAGDFKDSTGTTCHDTQVALCHRLIDSHANGGLEMTLQGGDPTFEAALANCTTEGLSQAMYDAIIAHRCKDDGYIKSLPLLLGGSQAAAELAVISSCPELENTYSQAMDKEHKLLQKLVDLMIRTQGLSHPIDPARNSK